MTKSYLGAVVEFRLPRYFVYGVCVEEKPRSGDTFLMFAPKFETRVESIDLLRNVPIRHKIKFATLYARSRKNSDVLKIVGKLEVSRLPAMDRRFRVGMSGISSKPCWQIVDGDQRTVVPFLTRETALLSDDGIPSLDYIRDYYDNDLYPWSAVRLRRGPLDFDPDDFEQEMRLKLGLAAPTTLH